MLNEENKKRVEETKQAVVANCRKLNIRTKPNKEADILCVVDAGTVLSVRANSVNGWARVYTEDGVKGYAMTNFIKEC